MFWVIVERSVHLTTLVLLIVMLSIIFTNNKSTHDFTSLETKIENSKSDLRKVISNNMDYTDGRVNKLSENQDNYQILVDRRMHIMEMQLKGLVEDKKSNQKIVNNNINTLTTN